ncbi:hypothetical protein JH67_02865 [Listeria monocytogenes]|nr:hypothetical protein [Listeria monocytogenes]
MELIKYYERKLDKAADALHVLIDAFNDDNDVDELLESSVYDALESITAASSLVRIKKIELELELELEGMEYI